MLWALLVMVLQQKLGQTCEYDLNMMLNNDILLRDGGRQWAEKFHSAFLASRTYSPCFKSGSQEDFKVIIWSKNMTQCFSLHWQRAEDQVSINLPTWNPKFKLLLQYQKKKSLKKCSHTLSSTRRITFNVSEALENTHFLLLIDVYCFLMLSTQIQTIPFEVGGLYFHCGLRKLDKWCVQKLQKKFYTWGSPFVFLAGHHGIRANKHTE